MPPEPPPDLRLFDALSAGVVVIVRDSIRYANPAAMRLLEAENPGQVIGRSVMDFIHPQDQLRIDARIRKLEMTVQGNLPTEIRIHTCRGRLRVFAVTSAPFRLGRERGLVTTFMDMTARSQLEQRLRESDEMFRSMLENMQDVFYRTDAQGITRMVCPAVRRILGYEPEEIVGRPAADFYPDPSERNALREAVLKYGFVQDFPGRMVRKDGRVIDISINTRALYDEDGQFAGVEGIWRDITERRNMERELERLATTDELTGLSNRRVILQRLDKALADAQRYRRPFALLLLDLDHFKQFNDRYGHAVGDEVLKRFAGTVQKQLRAGDGFGRMGGEEFLALLDEATLEEAAEVAERIRRAVQAIPGRTFGDGSLALTVSIGAAYCPGLDSVSKECRAALLEQADRALYAAKAAGRNRIHWAGC